MSSNTNSKSSDANANGHNIGNNTEDKSQQNGINNQQPQQQQQQQNQQLNQINNNQQQQQQQVNGGVINQINNNQQQLTASGQQLNQVNGNVIKPLQKPSTTITRPPRQNGNVAAQNDYVYQMGMARNHAQNSMSPNSLHHQQAMQGAMSPSSKPDDYDPDSNVYVANLPRYLSIHSYHPSIL